MGILKYKKPGESTWHRLASMMIKAINVVQEKGESTEDVMSQNAVTSELAKKQDASGMTDYYTKSDTSGKTEISNALGEKLAISDFNTYSGAVDTAIGSKASQSDLNTLSGTVTAHTADTTVHHTSTTSVTSGSSAVITSGGVYEQLDGLKLVKISQQDYDNLPTPRDSSILYVIID